MSVPTKPTDQWEAKLRVSTDFTNKNVRTILESEGLERFNAAKKVETERDLRDGEIGKNVAYADRFADVDQVMGTQKIIIYDTPENAGNPSGKPRKNLDVTYRSHHLWSQKSYEIEAKLKLVLIGEEVSTNLLSNLFVLSQLPKDLKVGMVDTLYCLPDQNTKDENGTLEHIFSQWEFLTDNFKFCRENCIKSLFAEEVYALVNDYVPAKKDAIQQQESASASFVTKRAESGVIKNYLAQPGTAPVKAVLKAMVTATGKPHVRPLCTAGDVVLAMHELADPTLFSSGCIQLPHAIKGPVVRDSHWVYRFVYELNQPHKYFIMRPKAGLNDIRPFVCPEMCPQLFEINPLDPTTMELDAWSALKKAAGTVLERLQEYNGLANLLYSLVLDFESCQYDFVPSEEKDIQLSTKRTANGYNPFKTSDFKSGLQNPTPVTVRSTVANGAKESFIKFRILQISRAVFKERTAHLRRPAICRMKQHNQAHLALFAHHMLTQKRTVYTSYANYTQDANNICDILYYFTKIFSWSTDDSHSSSAVVHHTTGNEEKLKFLRSDVQYRCLTNGSVDPSKSIQIYDMSLSQARKWLETHSHHWLQEECDDDMAELISTPTVSPVRPENPDKPPPTKRLEKILESKSSPTEVPTWSPLLDEDRGTIEEDQSQTSTDDVVVETIKDNIETAQVEQVSADEPEYSLLNVKMPEINLAVTTFPPTLQVDIGEPEQVSVPSVMTDSLAETPMKEKVVIHADDENFSTRTKRSPHSPGFLQRKIADFTPSVPMKENVVQEKQEPRDPKEENMKMLIEYLDSVKLKKHATYDDGNDADQVNASTHDKSSQAYRGTMDLSLLGEKNYQHRLLDTFKQHGLEMKSRPIQLSTKERKNIMLSNITNAEEKRPLSEDVAADGEGEHTLDGTAVAVQESRIKKIIKRNLPGILKKRNQTGTTREIQEAERSVLQAIQTSAVAKPVLSGQDIYEASMVCAMDEFISQFSARKMHLVNTLNQLQIDEKSVANPFDGSIADDKVMDATNLDDCNNPQTIFVASVASAIQDILAKTLPPSNFSSVVLKRRQQQRTVLANLKAEEGIIETGSIQSVVAKEAIAERIKSNLDTKSLTSNLYEGGSDSVLAEFGGVVDMGASSVLPLGIDLEDSTYDEVGGGSSLHIPKPVGSCNNDDVLDPIDKMLVHDMALVDLFGQPDVRSYLKDTRKNLGLPLDKSYLYAAKESKSWMKHSLFVDTREESERVLHRFLAAMTKELSDFVWLGLKRRAKKLAVIMQRKMTVRQEKLIEKEIRAIEKLEILREQPIAMENFIPKPEGETQELEPEPEPQEEHLEEQFEGELQLMNDTDVELEFEESRAIPNLPRVFKRPVERTLAPRVVVQQDRAGRQERIYTNVPKHVPKNIPRYSKPPQSTNTYGAPKKDAGFFLSGNSHMRHNHVAKPASGQLMVLNKVDLTGMIRKRPGDPVADGPVAPPTADTSRSSSASKKNKQSALHNGGKKVNLNFDLLNFLHGTSNAAEEHSNFLVQQVQPLMGSPVMDGRLVDVTTDDNYSEVNIASDGRIMPGGGKLWGDEHNAGYRTTPTINPKPMDASKQKKMVYIENVDIPTALANVLEESEISIDEEGESVHESVVVSVDGVVEELNTDSVASAAALELSVDEIISRELSVISEMDYTASIQPSLSVKHTGQHHIKDSQGAVTVEKILGQKQPTIETISVSVSNNMSTASTDMSPAFSTTDPHTHQSIFDDDILEEEKTESVHEGEEEKIIIPGSIIAKLRLYPAIAPLIDLCSLSPLPNFDVESRLFGRSLAPSDPVDGWSIVDELTDSVSVPRPRLVAVATPRSPKSSKSPTKDRSRSASPKMFRELSTCSEVIAPLPPVEGSKKMLLPHPAGYRDSFYGGDIEPARSTHSSHSPSLPLHIKKQSTVSNGSEVKAGKDNYVSPYADKITSLEELLKQELTNRDAFESHIESQDLSSSVQSGGRMVTSSQEKISELTEDISSVSRVVFHGHISAEEVAGGQVVEGNVIDECRIGVGPKSAGLVGVPRTAPDHGPMMWGRAHSSSRRGSPPTTHTVLNRASPPLTHDTIATTTRWPSPPSGPNAVHTSTIIAKHSANAADIQLENEADVNVKSVLLIERKSSVKPLPTRPVKRSLSGKGVAKHRSIVIQPKQESDITKRKTSPPVIGTTKSLTFGPRIPLSDSPVSSVCDLERMDGNIDTSVSMPMEHKAGVGMDDNGIILSDFFCKQWATSESISERYDDLFGGNVGNSSQSVVFAEPAVNTSDRIEYALPAPALHRRLQGIKQQTNVRRSADAIGGGGGLGRTTPKQRPQTVDSPGKAGPSSRFDGSQVSDYSLFINAPSQSGGKVAKMTLAPKALAAGTGTSVDAMDRRPDTVGCMVGGKISAQRATHMSKPIRASTGDKSPYRPTQPHNKQAVINQQRAVVVQPPQRAVGGNASSAAYGRHIRSQRVKQADGTSSTESPLVVEIPSLPSHCSVVIPLQGKKEGKNVAIVPDINSPSKQQGKYDTDDLRMDNECEDAADDDIFPVLTNDLTVDGIERKEVDQYASALTQQELGKLIPPCNGASFLDEIPVEEIPQPFIKSLSAFLENVPPAKVAVPPAAHAPTTTIAASAPRQSSEKLSEKQRIHRAFRESLIRKNLVNPPPSVVLSENFPEVEVNSLVSLKGQGAVIRPKPSSAHSKKRKESISRPLSHRQESSGDAVKPVKVKFVPEVDETKQKSLVLQELSVEDIVAVGSKLVFDVDESANVSSIPNSHVTATMPPFVGTLKVDVVDQEAYQTGDQNAHVPSSPQIPSIPSPNRHNHKMFSFVAGHSAIPSSKELSPHRSPHRSVNNKDTPMGASATSDDISVGSNVSTFMLPVSTKEMFAEYHNTLHHSYLNKEENIQWPESSES